MSSGSDDTQSCEDNDIPDCDQADANTQDQQHDGSDFKSANVTEGSDSPACNLSEKISRKRGLLLKHRQSLLELKDGKNQSNIKLSDLYEGPSFQLSRQNRAVVDMKSHHRNVKQSQTVVGRSSGSTKKCEQPRDPRARKENPSDRLSVRWKLRQRVGLMKKQLSQQIKVIKSKGAKSVNAASVSKSSEPVDRGSCGRELDKVYKRSDISQGESSYYSEELELTDPLKLSAIKFMKAGKYSSQSSDDPNITAAAWNVLCAEQKNESNTKISLKPVTSKREHSRWSRDNCFVSDAASAQFSSCDNRCNLDCQLHVMGTKMYANPYRLQRIVMLMCEGMTKLMSSQEVSAPSSNIKQVPSSLSVQTRASQRRAERVKQTCESSPTGVEGEVGEDAESLKDNWQDTSDSDNMISSTDKSDSEDEDWSVQSTKVNKTKVIRARSRSDGVTRSPAQKGGRKTEDKFCSICQKEFVAIKRHMLMHNTTRSFKCDECGKAFFEKRVLQKHKATHENKFKCNVCGEQFSKVRQARRHARIHVAEKPYICEICKRPFRTRRELRKHMVMHSNLRQYMCDICGHSSRSHTQFKSHQRSHTGEKPYVCEVCGKSFRYSSGLRVHNFSHTTGKPYRCLICNESFAHNYLLKRHRLLHEETTSGPRDAQEVSTITIELPDSNNFSKQLGTTLPLRLVREVLPETKRQHQSSEYSPQFSVPSLTQTSQLDHSTPSLLMHQAPQPPNTSTQISDNHPQTQPSKESGDFTTCQSNVLPQLQPQNPATSQQLANSSLLNEQLVQGSDASLIRTFLGPEMLKESLMYGPGSRNRTVEDCLVVPLSKESVKGQH